ncbi:hypothetical protein [Corallococcus sicarius]|uniref:Lipoprotein n=1 Tax=Corallococcus sicarius TaxID=2316726 RepID=A0A3A8NY28_9BACT|nr:hypothetical protein [Corallococcus sicarius]RKH48419.1 hypothetical protein D7X12_00330 [Corallococcus sicarius]
MSRMLALTSAAALSLFCAACNGGDEDDDNTPQEQLKDTRANVTGTHPVQMSMRIPGIPEEPEPFPTSFTLTQDPASQDGLRISFLFYDCDLTGTMTGESTFKVNPGTCLLALPIEDEEGCAVTLAFTGGSGGRDSAQAKIHATFTGLYTLACESEGPGTPITTPVTVEVVGT